MEGGMSKGEKGGKGKTSAPGGVGWLVGVQVVLVVLLLVAVNYLGFHHYERWDFSRSQKFRLATTTQQLLRQLQEPLKITVYFSPGQFSLESLIARDVGALLKEWQFSGKPHVEIETVDPTRDLRRAQEVQARLGFSAEENLLVLEYQGRKKFLPIMQMGDFDLTSAQTGGAPRVAAFRGEQALASALLELLDPEARKVYFLQGHGEPDLAEGSPMSIWLRYIARQNAVTLPLRTADAAGIPEDADMVVVFGPQYDLTAREIGFLQSYWENQGRLLILLDPDAPTPNLRSFVEGVGIVPEQNRVLRVVPLAFAMGIFRDVTGEFLAESEITKRFAGVNSYFPEPVQSLAPAQKRPEGTQLRGLIAATEPYWGEFDFEPADGEGVAYNDGIDRGYPVLLAMAAELGSIGDDRVEIQNSKMVVVGSMRFALDENLGGAEGGVANLDFLVSSLNWLLDRNRLTGIVAKPPGEFRLALSEGQLQRIALYTMVLIPGAAALLGVVVWFRRRS
jgi:hypothetical protein